MCQTAMIVLAALYILLYPRTPCCLLGDEMATVVLVPQTWTSLGLAGASQVSGHGKTKLLIVTGWRRPLDCMQDYSGLWLIGKRDVCHGMMYVELAFLLVVQGKNWTWTNGSVAKWYVLFNIELLWGNLCFSSLERLFFLLICEKDFTWNLNLLFNLTF